MGGLQGGSVPGGWHQQKWQSGPNRVLSQKVVISPWLGHLTGTPLCSAQKWGTLHVHKKWAHPSVSPGPAPDLAVLPRSAGWLHSPPGLLQWTKIYPLFYFWGRREGKRVYFIQAYRPQSSF